MNSTRIAISLQSVVASVSMNILRKSEPPSLAKALLLCKNVEVAWCKPALQVGDWGFIESKISPLSGGQDTSSVDVVQTCREAEGHHKRCVNSQILGRSW